MVIRLLSPRPCGPPGSGRRLPWRPFRWPNVGAGLPVVGLSRRVARPVGAGRPAGGGCWPTGGGWESSDDACPLVCRSVVVGPAAANGPALHPAGRAPVQRRRCFCEPDARTEEMAGGRERWPEAGRDGRRPGGMAAGREGWPQAGRDGRRPGGMAAGRERRSHAGTSTISVREVMTVYLICGRVTSGRLEAEPVQLQSQETSASRDGARRAAAPSVSVSDFARVALADRR
jgi:hypothetical protein